MADFIRERLLKSLMEILDSEVIPDRRELIKAKILVALDKEAELYWDDSGCSIGYDYD